MRLASDIPSSGIQIVQSPSNASGILRLPKLIHVVQLSNRPASHHPASKLRRVQVKYPASHIRHPEVIILS
ncbi:MAG: hypothetical protein ABIR93_12050 [Saprospiraceae bacterium]